MFTYRGAPTSAKRCYVLGIRLGYPAQGLPDALHVERVIAARAAFSFRVCRIGFSVIRGRKGRERGRFGHWLRKVHTAGRGS